MKRVTVLGLSAVLVATAIGEAIAGGGSPTTQLISVQSQAAGGLGADEDANNPAISANGRFVAFDTEADNLGGPVETGVSNIYVYDRKRQRVELISRRSNNGAGADESSFSPEISADGRFVVFTTGADNLGGPRDENFDNVYVYDRERDKTQLVSRKSGANGNGAIGSSDGASLSADGRFVIYTTTADNLGAPIDPDFGNVYVYDRERKKVRLVSRKSGKNGVGANGNSSNGTLSANGAFAAFETGATNLGGPTETDPGEFNIYVYDFEKRKVKLVSRRSGKTGVGGDGASNDPFISANGKFVAFETVSENLGGPLNVGDPETESSIYVYNLAKRKIELVSRRSQSADGNGADASADDPVLTGDGRFVTFEADARNLGGPLNNSVGHDSVYVYDRDRDRVTLVSRTNAEGGDDDDEDAYIAQNGRFIAFEAESHNLGGPIDAGNTNYIYVRDLGT